MNFKTRRPVGTFFVPFGGRGYGSTNEEGNIIGFLKGFGMSNSDVLVSHLQYVDDTLLIREACARTYGQ